MDYQTTRMNHWERRLGLAIATIGLTLTAGQLSLVPQSQGALAVEVGRAAQAQSSEVSDDEVMSYAAAVLRMDGPRTEAYTRIKELLSNIDYDISSLDMTCTNSPSLSDLPRSVRNNVRVTIVNYCNRAAAIVEENGLTAQRFNQITRIHPQDETLTERIRTAMLQLQQAAEPSPQQTEE